PSSSPSWKVPCRLPREPPIVQSRWLVCGSLLSCLSGHSSIRHASSHAWPSRLFYQPSYHILPFTYNLPYSVMLNIKTTSDSRRRHSLLDPSLPNGRLRLGRRRMERSCPTCASRRRVARDGARCAGRAARRP